MVLIIAIIILIIGAAFFITGPTILDTLMDALDEWRDVFRRIRERRS